MEEAARKGATQDSTAEQEEQAEGGDRGTAPGI